jgi:hypothetical protein
VTFAFKSFAEDTLTEISVESASFRAIEKFTVLLYDKNSCVEIVNEARRDLFCKKDKPMEALPPTQVNCLYFKVINVLLYLGEVTHLVLCHCYA